MTEEEKWIRVGLDAAAEFIKANGFDGLCTELECMDEGKIFQESGKKSTTLFRSEFVWKRIDEARTIEELKYGVISLLCCLRDLEDLLNSGYYNK